MADSSPPTTQCFSVMAARKVSPGDTMDVEADGTKAEAAPLGTMPHVPTLHHLAPREPTSFHQATIYYGLVRPDTPPRRRYGLLATSIIVVFLQCFVAAGFSRGVTMSSCSEQSECGSGLFCDEGICDWCEERHKSCCLANATDTCATRPGRKRKIGDKDREGLCSKCATSKGFETYPDVMRDRVDSMRLQDWLALFLASLVFFSA